MRTLVVGIFSVATIGAVMAAATAREPAPQSYVGRSDQTVTKAEYERWKKGEQTSLPSNWGRWGKEDQIGTMNLITPAKRKQAAALVKDGVSVSLAADADTEEAIDNRNPYQKPMEGLGADRIAVAFHGQAHTHFDSLAHHFDFGGLGYNGYRPDEALVMKQQGHPRNSIYNLKNGVFTRGVLLDIPRLKGLPYLEPGTAIYIEDLEAAEKMAGIKVSAGDALFVRTGVWSRRKVSGPWLRGRAGKQAGLDASVIRWLKQRDIAILASDATHGVNPADTSNAVHDFALVALGVHLFDACDLEAVAEAAASRRRWEFLLTVAPLPLRGGTGSPVNPIATF